MEEPMVTISLNEYNHLRDAADLNKLMIDKITFFESRMIEMEKRIFDLSDKVR